MAQTYASDRIAFIQACWHKDITDQSRDSFLKEMKAAGFPESNIDFIEVPGGLEIPLQAQLMAKTGKYSAIVATGLIVNGGIYRHEFVTTAVIDGIMRVMLDTEVPIISVILTPINFHEHDEHKTYFYNHFKVKGKEAAEACLKTIDNLKAIAPQRRAA